MTLHRRLRNSSQWISIAHFLSKDPLKALGLSGGWAVAEGCQPEDLACDGPQAGPLPESNTPPSNTGVNKVGDVARVGQSGCARCVVKVGGVVVIDVCEVCK